jgi:hypothetical protein
VKCPNCDAEMHTSDDEDEPDVWYCSECGFVEDRR